MIATALDNTVRFGAKRGFAGALWCRALRWSR
jgi:hypothetical protein